MKNEPFLKPTSTTPLVCASHDTSLNAPIYHVTGESNKKQNLFPLDISMVIQFQILL